MQIDKLDDQQHRHLHGSGVPQKDGNESINQLRLGYEARHLKRNFGKEKWEKARRTANKLLGASGCIQSATLNRERPNTGKTTSSFSST
uniref:Uncharacterized protein n=1 Tax=Romanomermis culicivorax TaxID=13658 RepID=A0A915I6J2_ROMCU